MIVRRYKPQAAAAAAAKRGAAFRQPFGCACPGKGGRSRRRRILLFLVVKEHGGALVFVNDRFLCRCKVQNRVPSSSRGELPVTVKQRDDEESKRRTVPAATVSNHLSFKDNLQDLSDILFVNVDRHYTNALC